MSKDDQESPLEFVRMGNEGMIRENFPDGSWRATYASMADWIRLADEIYASEYFEDAS